jgi:cyanate permease
MTKDKQLNGGFYCIALAIIFAAIAGPGYLPWQIIMWWFAIGFGVLAVICFARAVAVLKEDDDDRHR